MIELRWIGPRLQRGSEDAPRLTIGKGVVPGWRDEEVPPVPHVVLIVAFQDALLTIARERVLSLEWYGMETLSDKAR